MPSLYSTATTERPEENEVFHILFDGSVTDERGYVAMGGRSEELTGQLKERYQEGLSLEEAVQMAASALTAVEQNQVEATNLEAAALDRTRGRRKFRRLTDQELAGMVAAPGG
jgi:proteasome alpha subunit